MPVIEKIRKRHLLKKKEQKRVLEEISGTLSTSVSNIDEKTQFESGILDDGSRVLIHEGAILFFESEKRIFPTLVALLEGIVSIPQVTVDMGAVKFVVNGADVMRPGVTKIDSTIKKGSIVAVVDERHGKPLAVGISKFSAEDMESATGGKVVLSKHYIGDPLWEFSKT